MSWVPLPWCASQSTTSTRSPRSRSAAAVTATLLSRQKPIARSATAWWPGRPHRAERGVAVAALERVDRLEPAAGREQRGLPRRRPTRRCRRRGGRRPPRRSARGDRGTRRCAPARARPASPAAARGGAGRRAARRRRARRARPARVPAAPGWPRPASCSSKWASVATRSTTPRLTKPRARRHASTAVPVATLAAGEGAPGAVVPISWRRRPGRGVARPGRRRVAGAARSRRALAPHAAPPARTPARGRLPRGRHQRARARARASRSSTSASRCAAGCTSSPTTSSDLPPQTRRHPARERAPIAARAPRRRRGRVRRVLALRRAGAARSRARDARARTSASRRTQRRAARLRAVRARRRPPATCSASRSRPRSQGPGSATRCSPTACAGSAAHGAQRVYVNTQEDNDRALALYLRSGFTQLPVGLHVLGREL